MAQSLMWYALARSLWAPDVTRQARWKRGSRGKLGDTAGQRRGSGHVSPMRGAHAPWRCLSRTLLYDTLHSSGLRHSIPSF